MAEQMTRLAQSQQRIYIKFPTLVRGQSGLAPAANWTDYEGVEKQKIGGVYPAFARLTGEPIRGATANARIPGRLDSQYIPSRTTGQDLTLERPFDQEQDHALLFEAVLACFKYDLPVVVVREILGPGDQIVKKVTYRECRFAEWSLGDADSGDESGTVMETLRLRCGYFQEE